MLLPLLCILLQAQETVVIDGVTFSADRKMLINYPEDKAGEEYVVPEGTEVIGEEAFRWSKNLRKITLPLSLKEVDSRAMFQCFQLTTVVWGTYPQRMGESIFKWSPIQEFQTLNTSSNCIAIDGILFSPDKTNLFQYPSAKSNKHFIIPEGIETISAYAFYGAQVGEFILPFTLKEIGNYAFQECNATSIVWKRFPEKRGKGIFDDAEDINTFGVMGDDCNCVSLDGVLYSKDKKRLLLVPVSKSYGVIPEDVEVIGYKAFEYNYWTFRVQLPSSLKCIEDSAFYRFSTATTRNIEDDGRRHLYSVNCKALNPPIIIGNPFIHVEKIELEVPEESFDLYCKAPVWKDFRTINGVRVSIVNMDNEKTTVSWTNQTIHIKGEKTISEVKLYSPGGVLIGSKTISRPSDSFNVDQMTEKILIVEIIYGDMTKELLKLYKNR